mgnify:CR=1 FL=1
MARLPQYVAQVKKDKEIARIENGEWVLIRRTSTRVPGSKNPIVTEKKVAIVTPSGRVEIQESVKPVIGNFVCYEFGYSYALLRLCPYEWKASLKEDWENILVDLICRQSPTSYLKKYHTSIILPENRFIRAHQLRFWEKLPGHANEILQPLKYLQIVFFPDRVEISQPTSEQMDVLTRLNISIEGCVL